MDDEKMNLAQSLIEGEAEAWFYRRQKMILFRSWEHLRDCLVLRFGDRKDPELIRLLAKQDQFLKERRDESKIRRMKNTSIDPPEATPSMATIKETIPVEKLLNSLEITDKFSKQVDEISGKRKESKNMLDLCFGKVDLEKESCLKSQPQDETKLPNALVVDRHVNANVNLPNTQVDNSDSEDLKNIELRAVNSVLDNLEPVVMTAKVQKNIKMDVVSDEVERIQQVNSVTKNCSTHKMFDKMSLLDMKKKMKGLKSWMFKYKFEKRIIEKRNDHSWLYNWSRRVTCRKIKSAKLQVTSELQEANSLWDNREVLVLCKRKCRLLVSFGESTARVFTIYQFFKLHLRGQFFLRRDINRY